MEYLDGETLAARLERGVLPLRETLRIAVQTAASLGAGHKRGIVYGCLEPKSILLTETGTKLLDFGQARAGETVSPSVVPSRSSVPDGNEASEETSASAIAYLAPEQVEGKAPDARSDIFAFGAILHEMTTGERAFTGRSDVEVATRVLSSEPPPLTNLQPAIPPALGRLVRECLAKNPAERPSAYELEEELKKIRDRIPDAKKPASDHGQRRSLEHLAWWTAIGAVVLAVGMIVAYLHRPTRHSAGPRIQAAIKLPTGFMLSARGASIAFSPGGRRLAVVGSRDDRRPQIWLRAAEGAMWKALKGTAGASDPFWAPDGRSIGFFADHMLKRVDLASGEVLTICSAPDGRGGTWNKRGMIVFAPVPSGGLYRVPAAGGTPIQVSVPPGPAFSQRLPHFLPDGKRVVFLTRTEGPSKQNGVYLLDIETGQTRLLLHGVSEGRFVLPHDLAFLRGGDLMVQRFNASSGTLRGRPVKVAGDVSASTSGAGEFSFSSTGPLLYQTGNLHAPTRLTWFSLDGKRLTSIGKPHAFVSLSLAPDGRHAAVELQDNGSDSPIWIYTLTNHARRVLTPPAGHFADPVWSPAGDQVVYDDGANSLFLQAANGKSHPRKLWSGHDVRPTDWSPDGRLVAVDVAGVKGLDIWLLPVKGRGKPHPLLTTPYNESEGTFSTDGHWFAYLSDESGEKQLYVIPLSGDGPARQISTLGAVTGGWVTGQSEVAFETPGGRLFVVAARTRGKTLVIGKPRELLDGHRLEADVKITGLHCFSRDGKRVLLPVAVPGEAETTTQLTLVTNWQVAPGEK